MGPHYLKGWILQGSVLDIGARQYILQGEKCPCFLGGPQKLLDWEVSLILGLDTTFNTKGSVLDIRAKKYIVKERKLPCY